MKEFYKLYQNHEKGHVFPVSRLKTKTNKFRMFFKNLLRRASPCLQLLEALTICCITFKTRFSFNERMKSSPHLLVTGPASVKGGFGGRSCWC